MSGVSFQEQKNAVTFIENKIFLNYDPPNIFVTPSIHPGAFSGCARLSLGTSSPWDR